MAKREIVVGKQVKKPSWWDQKSVVLRKYVREMYSPHTLLILEEEGGHVYVDGNLVPDLADRIEPNADVVIYLRRS